MKTTGDDSGVATVDYRTFTRYKSELKADRDDYLSLMYDWMKDNGIYDFTSDLDDADCDDCSKPKRGRRFYFKDNGI